jgi:hypothetical protein
MGSFSLKMFGERIGILMAIDFQKERTMPPMNHFLKKSCSRMKKRLSKSQAPLVMTHCPFFIRCQTLVLSKVQTRTHPRPLRQYLVSNQI